MSKVNQQTEVRIAVDAFPYKPTLSAVCDYSGMQIFAKTALPLFIEKNNTLVNHACNTYEQENDGRRWIFHLKNSLYWQNGEQVVAEDYCRALKFICRDKSNRYRSLFWDIVHAKAYANYHHEKIGIYSDGSYTLIIELNYHNNFIPWYFTLINTSPQHAKTAAFTAGPYFINKRDNSHYYLNKNAYYQLDNSTTACDTIIYKKIPEDAAATHFHCNEVDVSCDTGFDLDYYLQHKNTPYFKQNNTRLLMLLSPGKYFAHLPEQVKHILIHAIDREAIKQHFNGALASIYSYLDLYQIDAYPLSAKLMAPLAEPFLLSISYEDFYPNRIIIDLISKQLAYFNIHVKTQEDRYGERQALTHLRFEIRSSLNSTPFFLIKSDLSQGHLPTIDFAQAQRLYSALLQCRSLATQHYLFQQLDLLLRQHGIVIPLLIMPTGFFCRSFIQEATLLSVGQFIHKQAA